MAQWWFVNNEMNDQEMTQYSGTSIIPISRLSGLFLWSQFGHEYLLVTTNIRNHILFKTTASKGAVKCESKVFCSQRAFRNFWRTFEWVLIGLEWNFTLYGLLGVVWKRHNNVDATQIMQLWRMMKLSMRTPSCNQFCWVLLFISIHIFDYPDPQLSGLFRVVPTSPDNRGSNVQFISELYNDSFSFWLHNSK